MKMLEASGWIILVVGIGLSAVKVVDGASVEALGCFLVYFGFGLVLFKDAIEYRRNPPPPDRD